MAIIHFRVSVICVSLLSIHIEFYTLLTPLSEGFLIIIEPQCLWPFIAFFLPFPKNLNGTFVALLEIVPYEYTDFYPPRGV